MLSYTDCKKYINDNEIKTRMGYINFQKTCELKIPSNPSKSYKKEWVDWYTFLDKKRNCYLDFEQSREYIRKLNFKSISEYRSWHKLENPDYIAYSPDSFYRNNWITWSDYLGHDYISTSKRNFLKYDDARKIVQQLNIKTQKQWQEFIVSNKKEYSNIPTCPEQIYSEFISYNNWLGTDKIYSNGELKIEKIMDNLNIKYEKQHRFTNCKYKNTLPFDFYIIDRNLCIEYDGEQHFEPRFGEEEFKKTTLRDSIKTQYCIDNGIKLIRISYLENIEEKLSTELNK